MSSVCFESTRPFYEAGMIVFLPTFRGENGNPGLHEFAYGEVDDLIAAVRFAAALPGVDPDRVFLIGHSSGGMVSALAALEPRLPVALTASVGGVYTPETIRHFDFAPFDVWSERERRLRSVIPFADQLAHRHIAYLGEEDAVIREGARDIRDAARRSRGRLEVVDVPGDHGGSLQPAILDFLRRIQSGGG